MIESIKPGGDPPENAPLFARYPFLRTLPQSSEIMAILVKIPQTYMCFLDDDLTQSDQQLEEHTQLSSLDTIRFHHAEAIKDGMDPADAFAYFLQETDAKTNKYYFKWYVNTFVCAGRTLTHQPEDLSISIKTPPVEQLQKHIASETKRLMDYIWKYRFIDVDDEILHNNQVESFIQESVEGFRKIYTHLKDQLQKAETGITRIKEQYKHRNNIPEKPAQQLQELEALRDRITGSSLQDGLIQQLTNFYRFDPKGLIGRSTQPNIWDPDLVLQQSKLFLAFATKAAKPMSIDQFADAMSGYLDAILYVTRQRGVVSPLSRQQQKEIITDAILEWQVEKETESELAGQALMRAGSSKAKPEQVHASPSRSEKAVLEQLKSMLSRIKTRSATNTTDALLSTDDIDHLRLLVTQLQTIDTKKRPTLPSDD